MECQEVPGVVPGGAEGSQVVPGDARWYKVGPGVARWFEMFQYIII